MTGISEKDEPLDMELGIEGFRYFDLYDAVKLKELAECFYNEVAQKEPVLSAALTKYVAAGGKGFEPKVESKILTDAAPMLSEFIARLFRIEGERNELEKEILKDNPITFNAE